MRILKAGIVYFALVFGAGFVLGTIRVFGIVPRFGASAAELVEAPIMLLIIIFAARWVVRYFSLPPTLAARLGAGFLALGLMVGAEITVVLKLRHLTLAQYVAARDPVAGTVYLLLLLVFAITPYFMAGPGPEISNPPA